MNLNGRRKTNNFDDRRGRSGSGMKLAGGGIAGILIALAVAFFGGGGDLGSILSMVQSPATTSGGTYTPTAEEEALADFSKQVMASTEDVWTEIFRQNGLEYEAPTLVLYSGSTTSGCGQADASVGPFYCSADESVYIDLSFFQNMPRDLGAGGDFTFAYVIAHEVGHHVQHLLGTLDRTHAKMQQVGETQANKLSVCLELQADFYAGVWAFHENRLFSSIEPGDIEEAVDAASKIGDDYLQQRARGYTVPDSFNHGTSAQRMQWLQLGLQTGDLRRGDTFSALGQQL